MSDEKDELLAQAIENDSNYEDRKTKIKFNDAIDHKYGFDRYVGAAEKNAWLVNIQPSELVDDQTKAIVSVVDFYFIEESGNRFRIAYPFRPYFYIATTEGTHHQVSSFLLKKYGAFMTAEVLEKEDLDLKDHLSGLKAIYIKLTFPSTAELGKVKKELTPAIRKNKERIKKESQYCTYLARNMGGSNYENLDGDVLTEIIDMREYDVPYHMRVAIDEKIFVGKWYIVRGTTSNRVPTIVDHPTMIDPVDPVVLAFDIETTKLPLKFPDRETDEIMMISYMVDGHGFLIINREIMSADVEGFEYTPKEEYKGVFTVWNEADELGVIRRFFDHILEVRPNIIVTYNGDFFDWPFVEARARIRGLNMEEELGFAKDAADEYKNRNCIHMDAFRWVKRDSYLPVGSQNLKAVAKAKLRYDPVEVDPEDMCRMAREDPQGMANYSVSDAVATYYLYMKYVHPFVFALCTIIPLGPDDVLRKGSGTLCEALLMVEAFHNNIVFPNKYTGSDEVKMSKDGHRIESETYVGGHVEALEAGVFRADIPCRFRLVPSALARLRDEVPDTLQKELLREYGIPLENVVDFKERCGELQEQFKGLLKIPTRAENPRIYHLDVGAMYPNIILTNRLQPCAMVTEEICMGCSYNRPDAKCKRNMNWEWRGELTPASRGEYQQIIQQLEGETFGKPPKAFHQLEKTERQAIEKKRIQDYSRRVYGKNHLTRLEMRNTTICQRENAFYVDTVKAFRDRRYDYKEMLKKAKAALDAVPKDDVGEIKAAHGRIVLYESLQLAHKCILNSFYGYVMRKGSRWFSMEMAGIVCHTGANIITEARKLVEQIGKPLELDTDGIWCLIPASFPENVTFKLQNHKQKSVTVSYPGAMLNALVNQAFTNDQYHNLQPDGSYTISTENSIFFEVDGPYQCMVLPASKEEGKKLKKRYAVFNTNGTLAELKGFEVKRRGELNIIKHFQTSVFKAFLRGETLEEVYSNVAKEADYWLDVLFTHGVGMSDSELFDLISENRSMSRKLDEYGAQKSTSISTAKRLAEFLGAEMVKDAGLACSFVISKHPAGTPVTDRAIPTAIFHAESNVSLHYLKKWTKIHHLTAETLDIRDLLDWEYYIERLGSCIQKIITIPAALQGVSNPVPRIAHPDWLNNKIKNKIDSIKQPRISDLFQRSTKPLAGSPDMNGHGKRSAPQDEDVVDIEDMGENKENHPKRPKGKEATSAKATQEPIVLEKKTLSEHGFDAWLAYLKQSWRQGKKVRKTNKGAATVDKMISQTRENLKERTWQVLSVVETAKPGLFNMWVAMGGQMSRFPLRIERVLMVNAREPSASRQTVRRILPHHKTAYHLYEYKTDEKQYQHLLDQLNAELCSSQLEGIYEAQTPLLFRSLLNVGCVCRAVAPPSVEGVYQMDSLKMIPLSASQASYLAPGTYKTLFLYKFSQDIRHVWCLVDSTGESHLYIVNRGDISMPNTDRMYAELYVEREVAVDSCAKHHDVKQTLKFTTRRISSVAEAEKEVNKALRISRQNSAKPTLLVMLVDEDPAQLEKRIDKLSLFPHVRLQHREPTSLLNQVDWQRSIVRRLLTHYFQSFTYLEDLVDWARYMHIPLGNVPTDAGILALDLFFARHLQRQGYALWASPSSRPDLGGKEMDDLRLSVEWKPLTSDHAVLINRRCFSADACVELELGAVAVTALVQRGRLLEAEGADDTVAFDKSAALPSEAVLGVRNTISAYDEGAAVDSSLKILKNMLSECVKDIINAADKRADHVVMSLSRWLHNSSSLLYDPAITKSVSVLERKLVLLLAAECERLGAKVIHATPTRIVLNTGKSSSEQAAGFVSLLIKSLGNSSLFAALHIRQSTLWNALLWYDGQNHTGIGERLVEESYVINGEDQTVEVAQPETRNQWRLGDSLPEDGSVREQFLKIVSGYVMLFIKRQKESEMDTETANDYRANFLIRQQIQDRLLRLASQLKHNRSRDAAALVNLVCLTLSCDSACEDAIDGMRENLQRVLDGSHPPSLPSTVFMSNIFCTHCSQSSDIDIGDEEAWICTGCQKEFSRDIVDNAVAERLNQLMTAYLMQDHLCQKCKAVRRDNLSKYCECSGVYGNTITPEALKKDANAASDVASERMLERTQELATWIIRAA